MQKELDIDYFIDSSVEEEKEEIKQRLTPIVAKRILKEASTMEARYFRIVADSMNFFSPPHNLFAEEDPFRGILWDRLKKSTITKKKQYYEKFGTPDGYQKASNKWFFKGDLQKFLKKQNVGYYFGESTLNFNDGVIEYRSKLENERKTFNEKQEYKVTGTLKTGGTNEESRPVFEPIREFFLNILLPKLIDRESEKSIAWELHRTPRWRSFK